MLKINHFFFFVASKFSNTLNLIKIHFFAVFFLSKRETRFSTETKKNMLRTIYRCRSINSNKNRIYCRMWRNLLCFFEFYAFKLQLCDSRFAVKISINMNHFLIFRETFFSREHMDEKIDCTKIHIKRHPTANIRNRNFPQSVFAIKCYSNAKIKESKAAFNSTHL